MIKRYNSKLSAFAKALRKNATKEENRLWYDFLCNYPIKFTRQKIIGNYIVDFYCAKAKLAIELDGSQHYTQSGKEYDANRTRFLESLGIKVVRIYNRDVNRNFGGVCSFINHQLDTD